MVTSIKAHRDEVGLTDGELLIDGSWGRRLSGPGPGRTATRRPARMSPRSRSPRRRTWTGPSAPPGAAFDSGHLAAGARAARRSGCCAGSRIWFASTATSCSRCRRSTTACRSASVASTGCRPAFVADVFDHHAGWVDKLGGETLPPYQGGDHLAMTLREPVGVVAAIVPWNAPLLLTAQKLAPALAAGCTVVLKPSEYATFAVLRLVAPDRGGRAARRRAQRRHRPWRPDRATR